MTRSLRVDIVSDVVCPWCIVGYKQLERAADHADVDLDVRWHPFELNPHMADEGEHLAEHLGKKYGATAEDSRRAREHLVAIGAELGFSFEYRPDSRIVPTFRAHQLLHWADEHGLRHALKLTLFEAYFSQGRDVSDPDVLVELAESVGLDPVEARLVLDDGRYQAEVREHERRWTSRGIRGVPAMVFDERHLVTGAQGVETFTAILRHLVG